MNHYKKQYVVQDAVEAFWALLKRSINGRIAGRRLAYAELTR